MLIDGLVSFLGAQGSVTSIATNGTGDKRIQPIPAPEDINKWPCITLQSPSDVSENSMDDSPAGIATARVVFDCLAPRYLDARNLAITLKALFNGKGNYSLPDGTYIERSQSANLSDRFDDGSRVSCTSLHVLFCYRDA